MTRPQAESSIGKCCTVNGLGDMAMTFPAGKYIGERVTIKRVTKGGMVICVCADGEEIKFPPKNLEPMNE